MNIMGGIECLLATHATATPAQRIAEPLSLVAAKVPAAPRVHRRLFQQQHEKNASPYNARFFKPCTGGQYRPRYLTIKATEKVHGQVCLHEARRRRVCLM